MRAQFTHTAFGCEWLHLDSADTCNTFSVAFRTVPASSNGVAHILEHSGTAVVADEAMSTHKANIETLLSFH